MWFVRAVSVPTTGLLFSAHAIMSDAATPLSGYDVAGLLAVSVGLIVYNLVDVRVWYQLMKRRRIPPAVSDWVSNVSGTPRPAALD